MIDLSTLEVGDSIQYDDTQWATVWDIVQINSDIWEVITSIGDGAYYSNGVAVYGNINIIEVKEDEQRNKEVS